MKTQREYAYVNDWQILNYSGPELENNNETDGIEEEREYGFYSVAGDYQNDLYKRKENEKFVK